MCECMSITVLKCINPVLQSNLTQDDETLVRVAYAENIAMLAETALR